MAFTAARQVISEAITRRAFPGAVVEVGTAGSVRWREAFGALTYDAAAPAARLDTIFDLASLTKVIATTTAAMQLVAHRRLRLDDPVARWLGQWRGQDRESVKVEDLLSHSSGLPAWLPLFRRAPGRPGFLGEIARTPLQYPPRSRSLYSDPGFMLLAFVLEEIAGTSLERLFASIRARLALGDITFVPPATWRLRTAPTEYDPWRGRLLVGEVHDENAAALGGVAGHAGLFGPVSTVGQFAQWMLRAHGGDPEACQRVAPQDTVARFTTRGEVPGSSRALGWDTMLPTSSCGTRMSSGAFGHTGFTGTSLWIDPGQDLYVVLLTNRVHPSRENELIKEVRPALHDAVALEAGSDAGGSQ
jgi:CubicO group peptidase (beta-lactamase class C family)